MESFEREHFMIVDKACLEDFQGLPDRGQYHFIMMCCGGHSKHSFLRDTGLVPRDWS